MYGDVIRRLRTARGMSRQELADHMQVSSTAVYKWETGATQPDIHALQRMAELFGVSIDTLCGYAPAEENVSPNMAVMSRAFARLTEDEQEKYLAVGRALFSHAFDGEREK